MSEFLKKKKLNEKKKSKNRLIFFVVFMFDLLRKSFCPFLGNSIMFFTVS